MTPKENERNEVEETPLQMEEEVEQKQQVSRRKVEYPEGGYGWVIVGAIIVINVSVLPLVQCFGIIFEKTFVEMGVKAADTSFLLHLHNAIFCSFSFFFSPLLKKYSFRLVALVGSAIMCSGIFLTSFAQSYVILIFTVSVTIGLGQTVLMPATYLAVNSYFKEKLTLATSFSVTGAGISSIFMPVLCGLLLDKTGHFHTILVLFFVSLLAVVASALLKPTARPKTSHVNDSLLAGHEPRGATIKSTLSKLFDLKLLKNRPFVVIVVGLGLSYSAELNVILLMQFILPELCGFTRRQVATVTSIQAVFDVLGRLVVPFTGHYFKVHPQVMYCSALVLAVLARTILALFYYDSVVVFATISLIGLTKGARAVYQSVIIPKYVDLDKIPAATGINMLFTGVVSLGLGPAIGAIHDSTNSYVYTLHAASLISSTCIISWLIHYFILKKNK